MTTATNRTQLDTAATKLKTCNEAGVKLTEARAMMLSLGLTTLANALDIVMAGVNNAASPLRKNVKRLTAIVLADSQPITVKPLSVVAPIPAVKPTCGAKTAAGTHCKRNVAKTGDRCSIKSHQTVTAPKAAPIPAAAKVAPPVASVRTVLVDVKANVANMTHEQLVGIMSQPQLAEQLRSFVEMLTEREIVSAASSYAKTIR